MKNLHKKTEINFIFHKGVLIFDFQTKRKVEFITFAQII